jgi:hypothetical protein
MFKARMTRDDGTAPRLVAVKFTPSFCRAAHALLADRGMVPALHYCAQPSELGRLFAVVMDWVDGGGVAYDIETHGPAKLAAVQALHAAGFVWGDARQPNVIVRPGGAVMLIDFDWSGPAGKARWPPFRNPDLPWPGETGDIITKEHDLHMLGLYELVGAAALQAVAEAAAAAQPTAH